MADQRPSATGNPRFLRRHRIDEVENGFVVSLSGASGAEAILSRHVFVNAKDMLDWLAKQYLP